MSVGGTIILITPVTLEGGKEVIQFTVVDSTHRDDITSVYAEPQKSMPGLREQIWWQGKQIFFDGDRQTMTKVGYSFSGRGSET
jgi:hypothetical protein